MRKLSLPRNAISPCSALLKLLHWLVSPCRSSNSMLAQWISSGPSMTLTSLSSRLAPLLLCPIHLHLRRYQLRIWARRVGAHRVGARLTSPTPHGNYPNPMESTCALASWSCCPIPCRRSLPRLDSPSGLKQHLIWSRALVYHISMILRSE